jgi:hypothetical protein
LLSPLMFLLLCVTNHFGNLNRVDLVEQLST